MDTNDFDRNLRMLFAPQFIHLIMSFLLGPLLFVNLVVLICIKFSTENKNLLIKCLILIIIVFGVVYVELGITREETLKWYWFEQNFD